MVVLQDEVMVEEPPSLPMIVISSSVNIVVGLDTQRINARIYMAVHMTYFHISSNEVGTIVAEEVVDLAVATGLVLIL